MSDFPSSDRATLFFAFYNNDTNNNNYYCYYYYYLLFCEDYEHILTVVDDRSAENQ